MSEGNQEHRTPKDAANVPHAAEFTGHGDNDAAVKRSNVSPIWVIPIVAAGLLVYLSYTTLANRGPLMTLTFSTAEGLTPEQTQVKHKAVPLGTVEDVALTGDMKHVIVHVRMNGAADRIVTDHARFWVVRPRLTPASISGLETIVSGAYIAVDPGPPGGKRKLDFVGLEEPPGVRSDEPGRVFVVHATRLGSLSGGAPVFYRDVTVGEVLNYEVGDGRGPVALRIFVKSPYDRFVHGQTRFWNSSGLSLNMGPQGMHLEMESIQAVLSGGISFETPPEGMGTAPSNEEAIFPLYDDKARADAASFKESIQYVSYFQTSVQGLAVGAPVQIFGVQVGNVDDVRLVRSEEPEGAGRKGALRTQFLARVAFEIQPGRVLKPADCQDSTPAAVMRSMVDAGLRVVLESTSLITGQKALSLEYVPNAKSVTIGREGDAEVLPSQAGGLDGITSSLGEVAAKLNQIPFDAIGNEVKVTVESVNSILLSPDLKNSLSNLAATLESAHSLVGKADTNITPALEKLPKIAMNLQEAVDRANKALGEGGYGANSEVQRGVSKVLGQMNDTMRTVRLLADFLERHPEALLKGRSEGK